MRLLSRGPGSGVRRPSKLRRGQCLKASNAVACCGCANRMSMWRVPDGDERENVALCTV
jgi:hypothetical protein